MYYCVVDEFAYNILPGYIGAVIAASALMYLLVENKAVLFHKKKQPQMYMLAGVCVVLVIGSLGIYLRAGVVKDVPELDISVNEYHRGMHAEYCDIPYSWNKEFDTTDKIKVLVLGNSFGRDWANVLSESEMSANLEISYLPFHTETNLEGNEDVLIRRAKKADIIFYVLGPDYDDISEKYLMILPKDKLYVVGNKNFGKSNGIIYSQRNSNNYLNLSIELPEELIESNKQMKEKYGDRYIDILSYVQVSDKEVRVFTENGKFISQDCRHLTENGAKYLAQHISWNDISSNQSGKG